MSGTSLVIAGVLLSLASGYLIGTARRAPSVDAGHLAFMGATTGGFGVIFIYAGLVGMQ